MTRRIQSALEERKKGRETKEGTESYIYLGKRRVLRLFLKGTRLVVDLIMAGRLFHRRGAEEEKALSPVRVRVLGVWRQIVVEDRRE